MSPIFCHRVQGDCESAGVMSLLVEGRVILFAITLAKGECPAVFLPSFLIHVIFSRLLLSLQITAVFAVIFCEIKNSLASTIKFPAAMESWLTDSD